MAYISCNIWRCWDMSPFFEEIQTIIYYNFLAGWTWINAIDSAVILIASYYTIEFGSSLAVRIINWFLLRSFPAISRKWCFVHLPRNETQLERLQRQLKFFFYILAVLMRWPGWKDFGLTFPQCAVRGAIGFIGVNSAFILLLVFIDVLIRVGHHLALILGWTPDPVPLWDHGYITEDAGHTPADPTFRRGTAMLPFPDHQHRETLGRPSTDHRFMKFPSVVYGNTIGELRRSSDPVNGVGRVPQTNVTSPMPPNPERDASLFNSSGSSIRTTAVPGIYPRNSWAPPSPRADDVNHNTHRHSNASGQTTIGGGHSSTGSNILLQGLQASTTGVSTEPRRRFT